MFSSDSEPEFGLVSKRRVMAQSPRAHRSGSRLRNKDDSAVIERAFTAMASRLVGAIRAAGAAGAAWPRVSGGSTTGARTSGAAMAGTAVTPAAVSTATAMAAAFVEISDDTFLDWRHSDR